MFLEKQISISELSADLKYPMTKKYFQIIKSTFFQKNIA